MRASSARRLQGFWNITFQNFFNASIEVATSSGAIWSTPFPMLQGYHPADYANSRSEMKGKVPVEPRKKCQPYSRRTATRSLQANRSEHYQTIRFIGASKVGKTEFLSQRSTTDKLNFR
uniref:Uncharacterized protein n=1 Tax=Caenorhabditis japonica TaxID=281687 RepID=A0A8R1EW40_CAEJA